MYEYWRGAYDQLIINTITSVNFAIVRSSVVGLGMLSKTFRVL